ncbi:MAG TPA: Asd/ArgC dimerization domain-containing protein, partial [Terriglobales bacterium]
MKPIRIGIVGASTLKGKEIKEAVEESGLPALEIELLDDETAIGKLEAVGDEATFIQSINDESLSRLDLAFFTGDAALTRKHFAEAQRAHCTVVDTSYALEGEPGYPVRSPWMEEALGTPSWFDAHGAVTAHPVATALALLLSRAAKIGNVRSAVATVLEPVSESGHPGMDELHQQTVKLLNFQPLPKEIFDTQVAFNLVQEYGNARSSTLERTRRRVQEHLKQIAPTVEAPALMMVAAPVFHAHTMSLYVETDAPVEIERWREALAGPHVDLVESSADGEGPSNISAAGE